MKATILVNSKLINISSFNTKRKVSLWDAPKEQHHTITIQQHDNNNIKFEFDFWTSKAQPKIETEDELVFAFACLLNDAISVEDTPFEEFCDNLGIERYDTEYCDYNTDSVSMYRDCKIATVSVQQLGINNASEMYNELCKTYGF